MSLVATIDIDIYGCVLFISVAVVFPADLRLMHCSLRHKVEFQFFFAKCSHSANDNLLTVGVY